MLTTAPTPLRLAQADGTTLGRAAFAANDFNVAAGVVSLGYANGQAASGSVKGFLTAADWTTFTAKVGTARTLTVAGTANEITSSAGTQDLSADRTWTLSLPSVLAPPGKVSVGAGLTKLSTLTVQPPADTSDIGGTTTANASTTIAGSGTAFTTALGIGDRISLSSAASTYATVTAIASDTSLTVSTALGNGTSQTINRKSAAWRANVSSGTQAVLVNDQGYLALGATAPVERLDILTGKILLQAGGFPPAARYNSQGVDWTTFGDWPSLIMNGDSTIRPEIAWLRGTRAYPEFAIRQHTTADRGGEVWSGQGTGVPILTMIFDRGSVLVGPFYTPTSLLEVAGSGTGTTLATASTAALTVSNRNTTVNNHADLDLATFDSNSAVVTGARVAGVFTVHTAGAVTTDLSFLTRNAGTLAERLRLYTSPLMLEMTGLSGVGTGGSTPIALRISATDSDGGAATWNTAAPFAALQFYSADPSASSGASVRAQIGAVMEATAGQTSALVFYTQTAGTALDRGRITSGGVFVVGAGEASATLTGTTLRGPNATGTNIAGITTTLQASLGTGTGAIGVLDFKAAAAAQGSGSAQHTASTYISIGGGLAFFGVTKVAQQTRGATLTNSVTVGGSNDVIADFTDLTIYANAAATIRDNLYQLARIVRMHDVALRAYGLET